MHGVWKDRRGRIFFADDGTHVVRCISENGELLQTIGTYMEPSDTGYDASVEGHLSYLTVKRLAGPFNKPTRAGGGAERLLLRVGRLRERRSSHVRCRLEPDPVLGRSRNGYRTILNCTQSGDGPLWRVLVADRDNDRVQVFDENGKYLRA